MVDSVAFFGTGLDDVVHGAAASRDPVLKISFDIGALFSADLLIDLGEHQLVDNVKLLERIGEANIRVSKASSGVYQDVNSQG